MNECVGRDNKSAFILFLLSQLLLLFSANIVTVIEIVEFALGNVKEETLSFGNEKVYILVNFGIFCITGLFSVGVLFEINQLLSVHADCQPKFK